LRGKTQLTCTMDTNAIDALLETSGGPRDRGQLHNAVIHRTKFLSGAGYFFVLINVAQDQADRCQHLFKLLSSHLKMALSRAITAKERKSAASLTKRELDILHLMSAGKSNREISNAIGISAMTLKNHVSKIYRKLNVQCRTDAVSHISRLPV
jgi:DNA-binding NarL/FixJ family response regulator